jgi:hypothetical protein
MRKIFIFLLLVLPCVSNAIQINTGCKRGSGRLLVRLTASKSSIPRKGEVDFDVNVRNVGEDDISLPALMVLEYYWLKFEIVDERGNLVPYVGPERKMLGIDERLLLSPNYSYGRLVQNVEREYDLSKPGKFRVRAIYGIGPDGYCHFGMYVSNYVNLQITK